MTQRAIQVLLVDDQPIVAAAVQRMLAPESDISFHYCQNPGEAIPKALASGATVILQDLVMPDIDGLALVRYFRAHPKLKDLPLIVLSTKEEPVTKAEAFAQGANDYLVKLPDRVELVARIRYHSRAYINLLERNEAYEKLASEIARAAEYVKSLLPEAAVEGAVRADWRFVPSAHLGGDSFGYHWIDPDHFAFYLLDVCGHGVGSALLSVSALNVLRTQSLVGIDFRDPGAVLGGMNEAFLMEDHNNQYFTLWYGVYHRPERRVAFSSAGHPPALLMNGPATARLGTPNLFIGAFPKTSYSTETARVAPAARLYLFSDGAYEVSGPDARMWTLDELQQYLEQPHGGEVMDTLHAMLQERRGTADLEDDFCIVRLVFC